MLSTLFSIMEKLRSQFPIAKKSHHRQLKTQILNGAGTPSALRKANVALKAGTVNSKVQNEPKKPNLLRSTVRKLLQDSVPTFVRTADTSTVTTRTRNLTT
jgi:hypothetical protein